MRSRNPLARLSVRQTVGLQFAELLGIGHASIENERSAAFDYRPLPPSVIMFPCNHSQHHTR